MRVELIARREAARPAVRIEWSVVISSLLLQALPIRAGTVIGFCWPYKAEYDARRLMRLLRLKGARNVLPVVVQRNAPLLFREWRPGVVMQKGPLGIPYPADTVALSPDIVLVPLVGFGRDGDRLGYGGGYFDRTLATLAPRPLAIGVGFELAQMPTTCPQPHDVSMDAIVTEAGIRWHDAGGLRRVAPAQFRTLAVELGRRRDLRRLPSTLGATASDR